MWTAKGLRWLDFESACTGPVEWDLLFMPFPLVSEVDIDHRLLDVLARLYRARVAIFCWRRAEHEEMRRHGEHHLELLRSPGGPLAWLGSGW